MTSFEPFDDMPDARRETGEASSPLDAITQEIVERFRRNECPEVSEYAARFPEHADDLRELLPTLAVLEKAGGALPKACPGDVSDPPMLTELGPYTILRELGRGGMGMVYEARHAELGRHVALKVLPPHTTDSKYIERFRHESRSVAKLQHPHIVSLFEAGEFDGVHFIAMQYIDGRSLDQVLGEWNEPDVDRRLVENSDATATDSSFRTANNRQYFHHIAQLGAEAASALAYAHDQGVLHRDVKPSNLLLDSTGNVWLADFGLARTTESNLTQTGDVLGTLRYLPPEALSGNFDVRGDVYSLGATLYELLTRRAAFDQSDRARLIRQIVDEQPTAPRRLNPAIPVDLETIVLTAMAKDPAQRYRSAHALADDLCRFLERRPIQARPASLMERSWRWCQRNRALAAMGTLLAMLLIGGMIVILSAAVHFNRLAGEREQALTQRAAAMDRQAEALDSAETARREASIQLYEAELAKANALRWSRQPGRCLDSLQGLATAAALAPQLGKTEADILALRNAAINSLALSDILTLQAWTEGMPDAFDPTLRWSIWWRDGDVVIGRTDNGQVVATVSGVGPIHEPHKDLVLSPDARYLLVRRDNMIEVWDVAASQRVQRVPGAGGYAWLDCLELAFAADGTSLLLVAPGGLLQLWKLGADETAPRQSIDVGGTALKAVLAPDGRRVAVSYWSDGPGEVRIWDLTTGQRLHAKSAWQHAGAIHALAWSPNGRQLAVGAEYDGNAVSLYDTTTGELARRLVGHENAVVGLAFTTDGQTVISDSWDGTIRFWDLASGEESLRLNGGRLRVATTGNRMVISEARSGRGYLSQFLPSVVVQRDADTRRRFDVDGELAFLQSPDGFDVFDWKQRLTLARTDLPRDSQTRMRYPAAARELFVANRGGISCFPVGLEEAVGRLTVGPPELVTPFAAAGTGFDVSADGRWLALIVPARRARALILDREHPGRHIYVDHPLLKHLAISPDGQFTVTTSWNGSGVKVWESRSGKLVADAWPDSGSANACFSPHGKWIVVWAQDEYRMFEVGNWRQVARYPDGTQYGPPGQFSFSPDATIMALRHHRSHVRLVDPASGRELAILVQQDGQETAGQPQFSLDGRYLITSNATTETWDLHALRHRLRELGLDWSDEPLTPLEPAEPAGQSPVKTATIDLSGADELLKGAAHFQTKQWDQAANHFKSALAANPRQHYVWNALGTCQSHLQRDEEAVASFSEAARLAPESFDDREAVGKCLLRIAKSQRSPEAAGQAVQWFDQALALPLNPRHDKVKRLRDDALALADRHNVTLATAEHLRTQKDWSAAEAMFSQALDEEYAREKLRQDMRYQALTGRAACRIERADGRGALEDMNAASILWYQQAAPDASQIESLAAGWRDVVERFPKCPAARVGLAHAYAWQGKWAEVVKLYVAAVDLAQAPPEVPSHPLRCIELDGYANHPLDARTASLAHNTFERLEPGEYQFDGVRFAIGAKYLALGNQRRRPGVAQAIEGIPIDCCARRIHFLHGSSWFASPQTEIGHYRMHYEDGSFVDVPIRWADNIVDVDYPQLGFARIAWIGHTDAGDDTRVGRIKLLVHWSWDNPHPEKLLQRMDFVAADERSVPLCMAVTAELAGESAARP